jgi:hypothetical protein
VGELAGTVETQMRFPMEDIGPGGAQFYSHLPLPAGSVHLLTLMAGRQEFSTQVKVRHVRRTTGADGEQAFAIGVEFLSMHPQLMAEIERWAVVEAGGEPADA